MGGRGAYRLPGPPSFRCDQRPLESSRLILFEGAEVLEPGIGFETIDRVPDLFHSG